MKLGSLLVCGPSCKQRDYNHEMAQRIPRPDRIKHSTYHAPKFKFIYICRPKKNISMYTVYYYACGKRNVRSTVW